MSVREVKLKAEYAADYPGITADVWMSAGELARSLVDRVHARRREGLYTRTFDPTHFEFRGGDTAPRSPRRRSRSTDRLPDSRPSKKRPSAAPSSKPRTSAG